MYTLSIHLRTGYETYDTDNINNNLICYRKLTFKYVHNLIVIK